MLRVAQALLPVLLAAHVALEVPHSAIATTRPRYGGTLRVEMRARVDSLDPRESPNDPAAAAATEKLMALAFERLAYVGDNGQPKPQLALTWQADAAQKRWEFRLRPNVKFHDGTPLTASAVAGALQRTWGQDLLVSASGDALVIESNQPQPDLLERLASGRSFVFKASGDGEFMAGTGPFRIAEWQARQRAVFTANDDHWGGRPFLDKIEFQMGINLSQQLVEFELGRADLIELAPDQLRRATQDGARIWTSSPVELLAVVFPLEGPAVPDVRLRRAFALAIDRAAIQSVLLQKQGEVATGLLPQWLSGYAFLFPAAADVDGARKLVAEISPAPPALVLEYDATDPLARAVAERVAVNASDVGLRLQAAAAGPASRAGGKLRLARVRLSSIRPRDALGAIANALALSQGGDILSAETPEQQHAVEKAILEAHQVIPVVHVPDAYGLSPLVRNWMATRWGVWRLEDAWLALPEAAQPAGAKP